MDRYYTHRSPRALPAIHAFLSVCRLARRRGGPRARNYAKAAPRPASALVFTDLQLPDVDSLTVLRAAKRPSPLLSIIIVTADASIEPAIAAVRLRAR
jgi:two-component system, repressor protein LuxO